VSLLSSTADRLGEADVGVPENLVVVDTEGLDPTLLPAGQGDEEPELDQLGLAEVLVKLAPQLIVGDLRVPDDGARVAERRFLPLGVAV